MSHLPTIMALRCFEASARQRSFTRAAQEIHLTQGAVSHQVLALESLLGTPLFVRRRAGLDLTAAGTAYLRDTADALRQIERATQGIITHHGRGGTLNVSVASSFGTYWLMPRLASFVAAYPEVTLNLSTSIGPADFSLRQHDAAIEYCSGATAELRAELVLPLTLRPYASPAIGGGAFGKERHLLDRSDQLHLLTNAALIRHTTVPSAWTNWLRAAELLNEVPHRQLFTGPQYDLLSMALNGAIAGLGIALLPTYLAEGAVLSGQIIQLSDVPWASEKAYYLRFQHSRSDSQPLQALLGWLAAETSVNTG